MNTLHQIIQKAEADKIAVSHFNISDLTALKAIFEAALKLSDSRLPKINLPVIIGLSEGEADFVGRRQAAALVKSLREEYDYPIFINADHHKSLEKFKQAVEAGFDAAMFDGSGLSLEENIKKTKEAVEYAKSVNPDILVEGELGYMKGASTILSSSQDDKLSSSQDHKIREEDLTKPEQVSRFIKETGIDLLAPAVGNIHGIIMRPNADNNIGINQQNQHKSALQFANPPLNIQRIREIKESAKVPLVLHGGSGIRDEDFLAAIDAGISVIHINTELRLAWRKGMEAAFKEKPEEIVPYKILPAVVEEIKKAANRRLRLFNRLD